MEFGNMGTGRRMVWKHKAPAKSTADSDILNVAKASGGVVATEAPVEETPKIGGAVAQAEAVAKAHEETPAKAEAKVEAVAEKKGGDTDKTAPAVAPATPALSLMDLVRNAPGLTDEQRKTLLAEAEKVTQSEAKSKEAKAMVEFNKALETELPKLLEELAKKFDVSLEGRRITAYFPKADEKDKKLSVTSAAKGTGKETGTRDGFPTKWGEAVVIDVDGKETKHKSPSEAAKALGLQVMGHRDMLDVFQNPTKVDTKEELPKIYTLDAVKGSHFRITIGKA